MKLLVIFLLSASLLANVVLMFRYAWIRPTGYRTLATKLATSAFAVLFAVIALEWYFSHYVSASDGFGFTLAGQRWRHEFWKPFNADGYRDVDHDAADLASKKVLLVVGDSFAAGHGIENVNDRFANVLARRLGDEWEMVLLAKNGWNTEDERLALRDFSDRPASIILSYYFNDVENAIQSTGKERPQLIVPPSPWIRGIVDRSHLFNFVYWRLLRLNSTRDGENKYWNYLVEGYDDSDVWRAHQSELLSIVQYAREKNVTLRVILWPSLVDIDGSRTIMHRVGAFFQNHDAHVVDVADLAASLSIEDRVVNRFDAHPSVLLHRKVAEVVYSHIETDSK